MKTHELPFLYIEAVSFFKCPLIWHWWLTKEVQGAIRDFVSHQNCFSGEIIVKRLFRRKKSFFSSFRRKIRNSVAIGMWLNANQKIRNTHLVQKPGYSLDLAESNHSSLSPLLPRPFPWARWRWGITFDEIQGCRSIHRGIKICSGKCSSCIFNILHFLLS